MSDSEYKNVSNTTSAVLSPPRHHSQKRNQTNKKRSTCTGYDYQISRYISMSQEYHNKPRDCAIESDYTSLFTESENEDLCHYHAQIKRWQHSQNGFCCFKCDCCLNLMNCINKLCKYFFYYKWFVVCCVLWTLVIFSNLYCFSNNNVQNSINTFINDTIIINQS